MKPLATLLLGGIEDGEYNDCDIDVSVREVEEMQIRLVKYGDVHVDLYPVDVDSLCEKIADVLKFEEKSMGAVSSGILRGVIKELA